MRVSHVLGVVLAVGCVTADWKVDVRLETVFLASASAQYYCAHRSWPQNASRIREFVEESAADPEAEPSDGAGPIRWDLYADAAFTPGPAGDLVITPDASSACDPFESLYEEVIVSIPSCEGDETKASLSFHEVPLRQRCDRPWIPEFNPFPIWTNWP